MISIDRRAHQDCDGRRDKQEATNFLAPEPRTFKLGNDTTFTSLAQPIMASTQKELRMPRLVFPEEEPSGDAAANDSWMPPGQTREPPQVRMMTSTLKDPRRSSSDRAAEVTAPPHETHRRSIVRVDSDEYDSDIEAKESWVDMTPKRKRKPGNVQLHRVVTKDVEM